MMGAYRENGIAGAAIALAAFMAMATVANAQDQGDVNGDGVVNLLDAEMIRDHLLEQSPLTGGALARADVDRDGLVTMADVVWVINRQSQQTITILLPGNVPLVMVRIPAGSFQMGSPDTERSRWDNEGPVHTVNIAYDFYMGKYELTQQQWLSLMRRWPSSWANPDDNPQFGSGDNYPAYGIRWNDCQNFIAALNTHVTNTGQGPATFRLPSEAEWEYACRAGTQTRFFFGDSLSVPDDDTDGPAGTLPGNRSDYMWYIGNNSPGGSKPVGTKRPNQFGLYDMHGNVWEQCQDNYHNSYTGAPTDGSAWETPGSTSRVSRGGYWGDGAYNCRSVRRIWFSPGNLPRYGVRLVRTP